MAVVSDEKFSALINEIVSAPDLRTLLAVAAEGVGSLLGVSRALAMIVPQFGGLKSYGAETNTEKNIPAVEWSTARYNYGDGGYGDDDLLLKIANFVQTSSMQCHSALEISNTQINPICYEIRDDLKTLGIRSILATTTRYRGQSNGTLILLQCDRLRRWDDADVSLLNFLAYFVGISLNKQLSIADTSGHHGPSFHLSDHSEAVFFRTNRSFIFTKLGTHAQRAFGLTQQDLRRGINLLDVVHPASFIRVRDLLRERSERAEDIELELHARSQRTLEHSWILVRLVPVISDRGEFHGWSGFGVDVTAQKEAQRDFEKKQKQVAVLRKVSDSIGTSIEAEEIANHGLGSLCEELEADGGICFLFPITPTGRLELAASYGSSRQEHLDPAELFAIQSVCTTVANSGETMVFSNISNIDGPLAALAENRGLNSAVVVPIGAQRQEPLGAIAIFGKTDRSFSEEDVLLINLAGLQIGVAARQSYVFAAYRKQTQRLEALYRLSHALSTNMVFDDIVRKSFEIMREELGLKRLWLGLVDDTGTRITGQSAYGSGWKRKLVRVNINIGDKDNLIGTVISGRKPRYLEEPGQIFESLGLRRIAKRIGGEPMIFVPLTARSSVLGIIAVQLEQGQEKLDEDGMGMLSSLSAEMAVVLFARHMEEKMIESERMHTAGLLASGIAHNFNNILQAIIGQASLIEIQRSDDPLTSKAANLITEASMKGASFVRQLSAFTQQEASQRVPVDINELLQRNNEAFINELSAEHILECDFENNLSRCAIDPAHLVRILSVLVSNAGEAMPEGGTVRIKTERITVLDNSHSHGVPKGHYVRVSVRDNGIGMSSDTLNRCFEPFFTTKNVDARTGLGMSGNGLGLAVAYVLAKRNGGKLVADSVLGQGSTFYIYLPIKPKEELLPEKERIIARRIIPDSQLSDSQLLIVESGEDGEQLSKIHSA